MSELQTAQGFSVANLGDISLQDFCESEISAEDIVIPRLLAMQGMSPKVLEGDASFGEVRDTLNWEVHGSAKAGKAEAKPVEFLPFFMKKAWIIKKELQPGKWKTVEMIKVTPGNEKDDPFQKWEDSEGVTTMRQFAYIYLGLVRGQNIPYSIAFRGASRAAGKTLYTMSFASKSILNVPKEESWKKYPCSQWVNITPTKQTKEDSTFIVFEPSLGKSALPEEFAKAMEWLSTFKTNADSIKMMDDDESAVEEQTMTKEDVVSSSRKKNDVPF